MSSKMKKKALYYSPSSPISSRDLSPHNEKRDCRRWSLSRKCKAITNWISEHMSITTIIPITCSPPMPTIFPTPSLPTTLMTPSVDYEEIASPACNFCIKTRSLSFTWCNGDMIKT